MASTRRNRSSDDSPQPPRPESSLRAHVALLAHGDRTAARFFAGVFEDTAVDWRLVQVTDGSAAARHVMEQGLPQLVVLSATLAEVGGPDLAEWLRSFRCARPLPILVYEDGIDESARKRFQEQDVTFLSPAASRRELFDQLSPVISRIEARQVFRNQEAGA